MNAFEDISIRVAEPDDLQLLFEVCRTAYSENFASHWNPGGLEWYLEKVYSLDGIRDDLQSKDVRYFVVFVGRHPAGFMKLKVNAGLDDYPGPALEIEKIYVRTAYHGSGLGKLLMDQAFQTARELEKKIIWLGVIDTNVTAFAFYKKLGFKELDKTRLEMPYFKDELKGMWRMIKVL